MAATFEPICPALPNIPNQFNICGKISRDFCKIVSLVPVSPPRSVLTDMGDLIRMKTACFHF
jgi:hypothetical protein